VCDQQITKPSTMYNDKAESSLSEKCVLTFDGGFPRLWWWQSDVTGLMANQKLGQNSGMVPYFN